MIYLNYEILSLAMFVVSNVVLTVVKFIQNFIQSELYHTLYRELDMIVDITKKGFQIEWLKLLRPTIIVV